MVYVPKEEYVQHDPDVLHTSVKGAINELEAATWLIQQGYEVFRNLCPVGKADIIAWKVGEPPIIIDVKAPGGCSKVKGVITMTKIDDEWCFIEKTRTTRNKTLL